MDQTHLFINESLRYVKSTINEDSFRHNLLDETFTFENKKPRILDVGCGNGNALSSLLKEWGGLRN